MAPNFFQVFFFLEIKEIILSFTDMDIIHFRVDKGGNPDLVRESQRRRFAPHSDVEDVIAADETWRKSMVYLNNNKKFDCNIAFFHSTKKNDHPRFKKKKLIIFDFSSTCS